jgi:signal transduction histidine kinase
MTRRLSSLSNRIFLACTLLAWLSISAAILFVHARLARESEQALQRSLAETTRLVDQQRQALFDTFTRMARLVADLPKLKAAMATLDSPTVQPIAAEYLADLGADTLVVTTPNGEVLALAGEPPGASAADVTIAGAAGLTPDSATTTLRPHTRGVLQMVTVPVHLGFDPPEMLGLLSVGFLLDDRRARQLKAITDVDLAFVSNDGILASTLPPDDLTPLPAALAVTGGGRLRLGDAEYAWQAQPMTVSDGEAPLATDRLPVIIVLQSTAESAATLRAVRVALGTIALVTALLAVVVGYGVARTVSRPLASITAAMREMARTGDLTRRLDMPAGGAWDDEDTRLLASTFNALTASIARFQREAAERDRLSALGRLSTVIAHEIRNPLMIITGALRQITRHGHDATDLQDAVTDIEEEVRRLNRVVGDVLDFARPPQFDLAPTDVNAVCTEAAGAVAAAGTHPQVALALSTDGHAILSDAGRLRTVLVNILGNACQAVEATPRPTGGVTLATERVTDAGTVRIRVRDSGPGISSADLPHVFDPYFTTRRTGTGLGLPIARSIIEGLGGSIVIESTEGVGTTVTIDLPEERPA